MELRNSKHTWRHLILNAIGQWTLANEEFAGHSVCYLTMGQAFNWRRLAYRIGDSVSDIIDPDELSDWLANPNPFGGFSEDEFAEAVGPDKYRAHLSYYYGVEVERALYWAMEEEQVRSIMTNGGYHNDTQLTDNIYTHLYGVGEAHLIAEFTNSSQAHAQARHPAIDERYSVYGNSEDNCFALDTCTYDEFTYWLFKRRIANSDQARLASDTKRGILHLFVKYEAYNRRQALRATINHDRAGKVREFISV